MTDRDIATIYGYAYKQASYPPGSYQEALWNHRKQFLPLAKKAPLLSRVKAFFSKNPAIVINDAGNAANPRVNRLLTRRPSPVLAGASRTASR